jgi:ferredoxin
MCEFCISHGEGKKWYLHAKNYSEDMLSDLGRRKFIENFMGSSAALEDAKSKIQLLDKAPAMVKQAAGKLISKRMKKHHFGQVVPIEEIERIFEFVNSVVRIACACRHVTMGKEKRYCYGLSMGPNGGKMAEILKGLDKSFLLGPHSPGIENLSKEEALAAMRAHEQEGMCHTVWTFKTPFIGGICNCDRTDCMAMRFTIQHEVPVMFKAEYIAEVDKSACAGCGECVRVCQFSAVRVDDSVNKADINKLKCFGCGICRAVCADNAITIKDRKSDAETAELW